MVRILQALSVMALISAAIVFVLSAAQWLRPDLRPKAGTSLSVVQQFRQAGGNKQGNARKTVSPLVSQAEAFAAYLRPPEPTQVKETPALKSDSSSGSRQTVSAVELPQTTPKFTLLATSYYRARPEESLALVSEPGTNPRWVTQGTRLGHFVVEEIRQRVILCRDGQQQCQIAMETKTPVDIEPGSERTLAIENPAFSRVKESPPESPPAEKPKTRPRQPMQKLGPARQEIHVVAFNDEKANG